MTSGRRARPASCGPIASPPISVTVRTPRALPSIVNVSAICSASSRVGASTSARAPGPVGGPGRKRQGWDLNLADVRSLKTLGAAGHFELYPVTFGHGLEALGLDGAVVNEDILAA